MANKELALYVMDKISSLGDVRYISMMGGYIFYYKERIFGGIYGNNFMVKNTDSSRNAMPDAVLMPPYDGAKPMLTVTIIDESDKLQKMIEDMFTELPERKVKSKRIK